MAFRFYDNLWDLWCAVSIVGIWPRFIEPWVLTVTRKTVPIDQLPHDLIGLKVLQISDLHLHPAVPQQFLDRIAQRVSSLSPDIIVFTGDFLCYSKLQEKDRLRDFLCKFNAPYGCFAILGNHDYAEPVSINDKGEYDIVINDKPLILRGLAQLCKTTKLAGKTTERARGIGLHQELIELIQSTPFKLLNNSNQIIKIGSSGLNICGLGEYSLGKADIETAFSEYDNTFPGLILVHNPDAFPLLANKPGDVVLCGHTHGGQVNLPWFWRKLTLLEDISLKHGLLKRDGKWLYINRGVGSVMPFRWFAPPELTLITLGST
jgi:predicted MPP superfamily phosphohydrolase